ncbi:Monoacylglycerol lipase [bioreactor metagenome]|uniref:Monoacylglycerol lipase n=1 Tax=bioreactor metagenome TaxID=1076179 RepID=A0A645D6I4_9ZZZZ
MKITHQIYSKELGNTFISSTGLSHIYYQSWTPENPEDVKGIFQIAHGMAEHSDRYAEFAVTLANMGYAVYVGDHIGHGRSVNSKKDLGYFGEKNGYLAFKNDARQITLNAMKDYPNVPVFFFGHSMGSFIARNYIQTYASDLAGAIICGTSGKNPAAKFAIHLADLVAKIKGGNSPSPFVNNIAFASYNKKFKTNEDKGFSWLSENTENVENYNKDPYCGFCFTARGFQDLFTLLDKVSSDQWYEKLSRELPILLISGKDDPVGNYGKGVTEVYQKLLDTGHQKVSMKLFDGMRHEILNETNREEVYLFIGQWLEKIQAHIK